MNLNKIMKNLLEMLDKEYDIQLNYRIENNQLSADANIKIFDNSAVFSIFLDKEMECISYKFIFKNNIEKNEQTLNLINEYNNNVSFFNAYIDDDNHLCFVHHCLLIKESNIEKHTQQVLDIFVYDDDDLKYLKSLIELLFD